MYFPLLDIANGSISPSGSANGSKELTGPGVRGLQAWIENAWHQGMHATYQAVLFYLATMFDP